MVELILIPIAQWQCDSANSCELIREIVQKTATNLCLPLAL